MLPDLKDTEKTEKIDKIDRQTDRQTGLNLRQTDR